MHVFIYNAGFALVLSFIPILVWLFFWLSEDWKHPEPYRAIIRSFCAGMLAVLLVLPAQQLLRTVHGPVDESLLILWAMTEEAIKFAFAMLAVYSYRYINEPIDYVVYMVTAALGFAAVENALFAFTPIQKGLLESAIITLDLRFVGATLIHIVSSAIIGCLLAWYFYYPLKERIVAAGIGLILATGLHALFNFLILHTDADRLMTALLAIWVTTILILVMLERVKLLRRPHWWEKLTTH